MSLNAKDLLAVIGGVVALSLSVVTILGWKFVTNDEFTEHATKVQQDKASVQIEAAKADKEIEDKVFKLKFEDKELEKSIELLEREDEHIKEKIQEVVVRQENTDSKVERIDKNIVILLEQNRLKPAPAPQLKPIPRVRERYEEAPADEGE